jgi:hypothetical protein
VKLDGSRKLYSVFKEAHHPYVQYRMMAQFFFLKHSLRHWQKRYVKIIYHYSSPHISPSYELEFFLEMRIVYCDQWRPVGDILWLFPMSYSNDKLSYTHSLSLSLCMCMCVCDTHTQFTKLLQSYRKESLFGSSQTNC